MRLSYRVSLNLFLTLLLPASLFAGTINGTVRGPDSTSAGIANAKVVLTRSAGSGGARTTIDSAVTNAQGEYSFANLPAAATPASYRVTASATGFQNANSSSSALDSTATVTLNILLPLPPAPGTIKGTVHALDSLGAKVVGAKVILNRSAGGGSRTPVDSAVTDAQGGFAFEKIAAGTYGISVTDTGYQAFTRNTVTLAAGATDTLAIVLVLPYGPASILGTVRGPDSTGPVIADAMVVLSKAGSTAGTRVNVDSVKTDAAGKFVFANLPAAETYGIDLVAPSAAVRAYANHNIRLRGVNDTLEVVMSPAPGPGTIMGKVTGPDTTAPMVGQMVVLTKAVSATDTTRVGVDSVKTDALGKYVFANIPAYDNYGILVASSDLTLRVSNRTGLSVDRDTVIRNVTLRAVGIAASSLLTQGIRAAWQGGNLALRFASLPEGRMLTVYSISGVTRYQAAVPSGSVKAVVPGNVLGERWMMMTLTGANAKETFLLPNR